ncbi:MAG: ABC transporter ATP-binding protein [Planctomycetaceae bacterium]|jgi:putative ABC transport system ATP-binding protein|nr:ABC transporter ATP-binding protein [Planctomycetaceae bacterium]MDC0273235.1 ABC transporter ATP-binding protein [Planctomycetaceae bacterium]MDG2391742.1 ABC transporter ATP-binding protein [Planctomycetaceae bacterium]
MNLSLKNIQKSYREPSGNRLPVLDIASYELERGEQAVLLGSSGGGKTTLLNVISGITAPDSGSVVIDGIDITKLHEVGRDRFRAAKIGFVFQTFNLLPAFSAVENVLLGSTFASRAINRQEAASLLKSVGLDHRLDHKPGQMSVGEQQRVAVARALANRPVLLLADEPTANVDQSNQDGILKLIRESCVEHQISLMLVTHSQEVADQFDRVDQLIEFNRAGATTS